MKLLLAGATGLVGRHVLERALADARVQTVTALTRRALPAHEKLLAAQVDFENLPEHSAWWQADAVICTLGTTLSTAGSRPAFRRVDYDYPLTIAKLARQHGTPTYVLNSAIGANPASRFFYNRIKGELERDVGALGFPSLTCVRPTVIAGQRDEIRQGERALKRLLQLLGPILPPRWRLNPAKNIAQTLLNAALLPQSGVHVVTSDRLI